MWISGQKPITWNACRCGHFIFQNAPWVLILGKRSSKYTTNLVRGVYVLDLVGLECTSYMVAIFYPSECQGVTGSAAQSGLHSLQYKPSSANLVESKEL
jgi:hypothetical protein